MGEWNELVANLPGLAGGGMRAGRRQRQAIQFISRSHPRQICRSHHTCILIHVALSHHGSPTRPPRLLLQRQSLWQGMEAPKVCHRVRSLPSFATPSLTASQTGVLTSPEVSRLRAGSIEWKRPKRSRRSRSSRPNSRRRSGLISRGASSPSPRRCPG